MHAAALLQLTYLQSYEQMGVLQLTCLRGCECSTLTIDAMLPSQSLATLNTTITPLTQSRACVLQLVNVARATAGLWVQGAPQPSMCPEKSPPEPCTKLKVVALSISSIDVDNDADVWAAIRSVGTASGRSTEVNGAIGLDFL